MDAASPKSTVVPFSLKEAPSLIERVWPAQKISVEAQKERKAVKGQTLTGLGSYWKGRKPLILVRACVLGALLPSTGNDEKDLEIFELLCGMADQQIADRFKLGPTVAEILAYGDQNERDALLDNLGNGDFSLRKLPKDERIRLFCNVLSRMPYQMRSEKLLRPEEVNEELLTGPYMNLFNRHLGTSADNIWDLIGQLGIMRFGTHPRVGDVFCGGGSIPFEAARLGCETYASDLNPLACMLTWGALNVVGGTAERRDQLIEAEHTLIEAIGKDVEALDIEYDSLGNKAKAFLYCLETRCPQTGMMVPMSPSWVVSRSKRIIAVLAPDSAKKRYDIEVRPALSDEEFLVASRGTIQSGNLVHCVDGEVFSTPIKSIRGDRKGPNGETITNIRPWEKSDFAPRPDDLFQERLYAIQWVDKNTIEKARPHVFFSAVRDEDVARERKIEEFVKQNLHSWQDSGLIPDAKIETGDKTNELIRTRGWTHWHHVFTPRDYIILSSLLKHNNEPEIAVMVPSLLNHSSKLCRWGTSNAPLDKFGRQAGGAHDLPQDVFYNQAFNTLYNYSSRASDFLLRDIAASKQSAKFFVRGKATITNAPASNIQWGADVFITDPPYADAVHYDEISEFFIAWLRRRPPQPCAEWIWDSRRGLAIKGDGEEFRHNMVVAYRTMAERMPDNGLQIVMFTHQSASVWGDMTQIFWGAGLQVIAAWYIATETTSELKKGGYVQGTVVLILRKRSENAVGYKDEIVQEVKAEVADQIDTMVGFNQNLNGQGRIENLFEDADLQMAGYAAALRVLTRYERIDGIDMTKEALRPRRAGEKNIVGEIIDFAVQVANEHMVPVTLPPTSIQRDGDSDGWFCPSGRSERRGLTRSWPLSAAADPVAG
ncbi:MAG: DUF1156 domain-containing protein [Rhizobiales bacterium]|nr:DUF1156 domain-containing protein [Hyphomicrobiales bacterium]